MFTAHVHDQLCLKGVQLARGWRGGGWSRVNKGNSPCDASSNTCRYTLDLVLHNTRTRPRTFMCVPQTCKQISDNPQHLNHGENAGVPSVCICVCMCVCVEVCYTHRRCCQVYLLTTAPNCRVLFHVTKSLIRCLVYSTWIPQWLLQFTNVWPFQ